MGNAKSITDRDSDWPFVGRDKELNDLQSLLINTQIVEVFGILQIGKSRLLLSLIQKLLDNQTQRKRILLFFDFNLYQGSAQQGLVDCFNEAVDTLNHVLKVKVTSMKNVKELVRIFKEAVENATQENEEVIVCLDNIQVIVESQNEKEKLLTFFNDVIKETKVKLVLTSNVKIGLTCRGFASFELGPLADEGVTGLINEITEGNYKDETVYMPIIARLCEGLPLAAMITATELKEDDYFMELSEMLELLFTKRLEAMSPEMYPAEAQLNFYKNPIKKVDELTPYLAHFLREMAESTSGETVSVDDAIIASGNEEATRASTKKDAQTLQRRGVLNHLRKDSVGLPGVFRECALLMDLQTSIHLLPDDERQCYDEKLRKSMQENIRRSGLDVPDTALESQRALEQFLLSLATPAVNKEAVEHDDDSVMQHDGFNAVVTGNNVTDTEKTDRNTVNGNITDIERSVTDTVNGNIMDIERNVTDTVNGHMTDTNITSTSQVPVNPPEVLYSRSSASNGTTSVNFQTSSSKENDYPDKFLVSSTTNDLDTLPSNEESKILNSPKEGGLQLNIPSEGAAGTGTTSSWGMHSTAHSESSDEQFSLGSGPRAMSYRSINDSLTDNDGSVPNYIRLQGEKMARIGHVKVAE